MKRLFYISFVLATFLVFNSCPTPLDKYDPKNDVEKNITDLLNTYLDARNNGDINRLQATFHDNGTYYHLESDKTFTKSQIADSDSEWWANRKLELFNPKIKINNNEATVSIDGEYAGLHRYRQIYTLVKEDDKWLILKDKEIRNM